MILGSTAAGLLIGGLLWVIVTGLVARAQLEHVQRQLRAARTSLAAGDVHKAATIAREMSSFAASAHALTSGPAWWVAANLPYIGSPALTTRIVAEQSDALVRRVVPPVLHLGSVVTTAARTQDGGLDLALLGDADAALTAADDGAARSIRLIRAAPASWLGPVSGGRSAALHALDKIEEQLRSARDGVHVALPMLGADGPRRYFIGFLNEAEARGVGGIPGAYAIATVDHGHVRFEHFGSDTELQHFRADVHFGAQYDARYGQDDPAGVIQNSDISPHFQYAAQIWAGMWQAKTGQRIDGALAIDPTALSYLLRAVDDVDGGNKAAVTAQNVVALTQQRQYSLFPGLSTQASLERKAYLIRIARTVAGRLSASGHLRALANAFVHAAHERRLVVWSAIAREERAIIAGDLGGALESSSKPFTGFSVVNGAGSKLDYYLYRSMIYRRQRCGSGSPATATIKLINEAPTTGLPKYVTYRADKPRYPTHPGDNYLLITYYGTPGARIGTVTIDGRSVPASIGTENGLSAVTVGVELPAQATRRIAISLTEPRVRGAIDIFRQPSVHPVSVLAKTPGCG